MNIDRQQLQMIVREVAKNTLLPLYHHVQREYKKDGSIITRADRAVQQALSQRLACLCPDVLLLGEEMPSELQQTLLDCRQPLWCLDPIDGTSNFAAGLPFFSISLAFIESGEVKIGIVLDPVRDELFSAVLGQGAWLNDEPLLAQNIGLSLERSMAFIDFKHLPQKLTKRLVKDKPFGSQRNLGSIALELCWLAAGRGHIYLHGNQQIWDYAAAELILTEAGGYTSTLQEVPSDSHSLQQGSNFAAIDHSLFEEWRAYLAGAIK